MESENLSQKEIVDALGVSDEFALYVESDGKLYSETYKALLDFMDAKMREYTGGVA